MLVTAINEPGSPNKGITLLRRELAKWQALCPLNAQQIVLLH